MPPLSIFSWTSVMWFGISTNPTIFPQICWYCSNSLFLTFNRGKYFSKFGIIYSGIVLGIWEIFGKVLRNSLKKSTFMWNSTKIKLIFPFETKNWPKNGQKVCQNKDFVLCRQEIFFKVRNIFEIFWVPLWNSFGFFEKYLSLMEMESALSSTSLTSCSREGMKKCLVILVYIYQ